MILLKIGATLLLLFLFTAIVGTATVGIDKAQRVLMSFAAVLGVSLVCVGVAIIWIV